MNLRIYTLSVSLAAVIGLLLAIGPTLRSALEYRSVDMPAELASADTFFVAKGKDQSEQAEWRSQKGAYIAERVPPPGWWLEQSDKRWQAMYEAAKGQHIQTMRWKALRGLLAYGAVCVLCVVLLAVHLRWARRLERRT